MARCAGKFHERILPVHDTVEAEMIRRWSVGTLALAGLAAWACTLPETAPPGESGGGTSGAANGGTATGGAATGGTATGGTATGGTATGGTATGGTATGGTATGGTATGGTATGGTATGGTATGGTTTGGTTTGGTAGSGTGGSAGAGGGTGGSGGSATGGSAGTPSGGTGGSGGSATGGSAGTVGGKGGTGGSGGTPGVLAHRYSFSGTDTVAVDSVGNRNGTITGGTQSGGVVTLSGGTSDQYVSLPGGLISGLTNATFEAWVTWTGGTSNWQRLFDFGTNENGEGAQGAGTTYVFFTPRAGAAGAGTCTGAANFPRVAITQSGPTAETCVSGSSAFPSGLTHIAVTIGSTMSLYINGQPIGTPVAPAVNLGGVVDQNNWLGRSQFTPDAEFAGSISEFRIYPTERSASQIAASNTAGPDTPPTQ
jgi:hypothetical protein